MPCESYGGGRPLEDAAAKLEVLDAVCPGGLNDTAVITIGVRNSTPLSGYTGKILVDDLFGFLQGGFNIGAPGCCLFDLTGTGGRAWYGVGNKFTSDRRNEITFSLFNDFYYHVEWHPIPPGELRPVFEIRFLLKPGIKKGDYPLSFETGELIDAEAGRRIIPELKGGTLHVLEDLAPEAGCKWCVDPTLDPDYVPPPPPKPPQNVTFKLGDATAPPGGEVVVPWTVNADAFGRGYVISIDFDEEVLQVTSVEFLFEDPDGTRIPFWGFGFNNENRSAGNGGTDEGFVGGYALCNYDDQDQIPANQDNLMAAIHFRVNPDVPPPTTTEVRFLDGAWPKKSDVERGPPVCYAGPLRNEYVMGIYAYYPESEGSIVFIGSRIQIIPDGIPFSRGDANGDGMVDVSDASFTLGYLFLGDAAPPCLDAADADDDGQIDITDPIATLAYLFLGPAELPPPGTVAGRDPTPDDLDCSGKR